MEPLGAVASIVAVIQLSSEVIGFIGTAKGATKERKRLREEIQACDDILQQIKDEADESGDGDAWAETIKALEESNAPLGRLSVALNAIKAKLEVQDSRNKILKSLKWPFEGKEVDKIISAIEREKALLNLALANDHRKLTQNLRRSAKDNQKQLLELVELVKETSNILKNDFNYLAESNRNQEAYKKSHQILKWLTPIDYASQQTDFINRRTPGTGQWLLDSKKFQSWINSDTKTLFCPGIPGAGKTILTSIVVDHLYTKFRDSRGEDISNVGIAYIYFNFSRQHEQTLYDVLASVLKQLCHARYSLPNVLRQLYKKYQDKRTQPPVIEVSRTLQLVAKQFSRVFVVIDAIDECQSLSGCQAEFLSEIFGLEANVFATSRPILRIGELFEQSTTLEIAAREGDVRMYLVERLPRLPGFVKKNQSLQEEVITTIINLVQGMFLLAQLYVDSLVGKRSVKALRLALAALPAGSEAKAYDFAYESAMERIESQLVEQEHLAKQVLSWIVCAARPLTTLELQHALAVEQDEFELDADNLTLPEDMISVCAGLVTVDDQSGVIRLVHYTTQEYFERTRNTWFPDAHTMITVTCATYLSFSTFGSGPCETEQDLYNKLRSYPLYRYATCYWGHHAEQARLPCRCTRDFLANELKVQSCFQAANYHEDGLIYPLPKPLTGLHLAVQYAGAKCVDDLLRHGWNYNSIDGDLLTLLCQSAKAGRREIVKRLLIECGLDPYLIGVNGLSLLSWTMANQLPPIFWDAQNGNGRTTAQLLATTKIIVDMIDISTHQTPLWVAAANGRDDVLRILLETRKVNINAKNDFGQTPLMAAAIYGHQSVVDILLQTGEADIAVKDNFEQTPLLAAAKHGHRLIVKKLLDIGRTHGSCTDRNAVTISSDASSIGDSAGIMTPFQQHAANVDLRHINDLVLKISDSNADISISSQCSIPTVSVPQWTLKEDNPVELKVLHDQNVDVNVKDGHGRTPLSYAAEIGRDDIVELLLENGAETEIKDKSGKTPLTWTSRAGHSDTANCLLAKGANIDTREYDGNTPLMWSARFGFSDVTRLLVLSGADIKARDRDVNLLLILTVKFGYNDILDYLLQQGGNIESRDMYGNTLLTLAVKYGHDNTVRFLLSRNANSRAVNRLGRTALHCAAERGNQFVVDLLLTSLGQEARLDSRGCPSTAREDSGEVRMIGLLIGNQNLRFPLRDYLGRTPLADAAINGQAAIVELFLDLGFDGNVKDNMDWAPLDHAKMAGHDEIVRLLQCPPLHSRTVTVPVVFLPSASCGQD